MADLKEMMDMAEILTRERKLLISSKQRLTGCSRASRRLLRRKSRLWTASRKLLRNMILSFDMIRAYLSMLIWTLEWRTSPSG